MSVLVHFRGELILHIPTMWGCQWHLVTECCTLNGRFIWFVFHTSTVDSRSSGGVNTFTVLMASARELRLPAKIWKNDETGQGDFRLHDDIDRFREHVSVLDLKILLRVKLRNVSLMHSSISSLTTIVYRQEFQIFLYSSLFHCHVANGGKTTIERFLHWHWIWQNTVIIMTKQTHGGYQPILTITTQQNLAKKMSALLELNIPKYHSREMCKQFFERFGVVNSKPSVLAEMYQLTYCFRSTIDNTMSVKSWNSCLICKTLKCFFFLIYVVLTLVDLISMNHFGLRSSFYQYHFEWLFH